MNNTFLFGSVNLILEQIQEYPEEVLTALSASEQTAFFRGLDELAVELPEESESMQVLWVQRFFSFLENYPKLKELVMEQGTGEKVLRQISQEAFAASVQKQGQAQQTTTQIRNAVLECKAQLMQSLGDSPAASKPGRS